MKLDYVPVELAFGTSGLRGLVTDMTDLECYINVRGFLAFLENSIEASYTTVYIAGDLRASTPRIMRSVSRAITDAGKTVSNCGFIPTPALALYAQQHKSPCIMVTGSHIPDDRNGIKFYKPSGEVLKADESSIKTAVSSVRHAIYESTALQFDAKGMLIGPSDTGPIDPRAADIYIERYVSVFSSLFTGKQVVIYQHSAVGRDMLVTILRACGAYVKTVGRSNSFVPIDTENVTDQDAAYFKSISAEYPEVFAILSTDGDSDRPFVIDELGVFHRGDDLGALIAPGLGANFAAYPISSSDSVDMHMEHSKIPYVHTMIGSPHVIVAMENALSDEVSLPVGWEVNGGFLIGNDLTINGRFVEKLATRDAFFPMLFVLKLASEQNTSVSKLFSQLPPRFTQAGMIDDFPSSVYQQIKAKYKSDTDANRRSLEEMFSGDIDQLGRIKLIDITDGVRMYFDNGDIIHVRGSGNAPQLRIYSVSDSQERADQIVRAALQDAGPLRRLQQAASSQPA